MATANERLHRAELSSEEKDRAAFNAYLANLPPEQAAGIRARPPEKQFNAALELAESTEGEPWPKIESTGMWPYHD